MELEQEDVGPDEIFQSQRVQTEERGAAALSLSFAATVRRGKEERGAGMAWEVMAREVKEKQEDVMPPRPILMLLKGQI